VLVLPSDQQVEDEQAWAGTLRRAIDASFGAPRHVVIVGVEAQPDPDFGWILPGEWVDDGTRAVLGFVEKPGALQAMRLARAGALCSSFTFAASATALLAVLRRHRSRRFNRFASAPDAARMLAALEATEPHELPHSDFSHDLIERATQWVRVVSGAPCGWTDLGTPERLARWLARSSPRTAAGEATLPAARARAVPAASAPARTRGHATAASLSDGDTTCVR
jgi:mannose-1-phosphate guanylyltransferase